MNDIRIPVGTSYFAEIRNNQYYYVDKTGLIAELIKADGTKVTLITRPRRFGKTLGMSMLTEFFDIRRDSRSLFAGLKIADDSRLCEEWQNKWPVIFVSFRGIDGLQFESAMELFSGVIQRLFVEHSYLLESPKIPSWHREIFERIASRKGDAEDIKSSLITLTDMMAGYYGKPVILLVDEYDVPLAKAGEHGYYEQMLDVIKGVMRVFKDNPSLRLAVVTGCLRIAKESIFTGTNNFVSDTISDSALNEFFGFTQPEVDRLLSDTGLDAHREEIGEWYDGYRFGNFDVYCPWDVMNYVRDLLTARRSRPGNYWENTSDNAIIRTFLTGRSDEVQEEFETLLDGRTICEPITDNLTYDTLRSSKENLWSLLYFTGYLTAESFDASGKARLKIPNKEVRGIFKNSVKEWLALRMQTENRSALFAALWAGDEQRLTQLLSDLLFDCISFYDYAESFYHAFLTGLFANAGYQVESNYETGLGRSDLVIKDTKNRRAVVIEAKRTNNRDQLSALCAAALKQIADKKYAEGIAAKGYQTVVCLGIAFFGKECLVKSGIMQTE